MSEGWAQRLRAPGPLSVGLAVIAWLCLLLVVYLTDTPTLSGLLSRTSTGSPSAPQTRHFDGRLATGSADLPYDSPQVQRSARGTEPEQIHLALAGPAGMAVSWATGNATQLVGEAARKAPQEPDSKAPRPASVVQYGLESGKLSRTAKGAAAQRYTQQYSNASYTSGFLHHVKLDHLLPGSTYYYRCGDPAGSLSPEMSFMSAPAISPDAFPQRLGIIGDLGQTFNSSSTLDHLIASKPPIVILVGDLSYADTYAENGSHLAEAPRSLPTSFHPRWDTYGRFIQPLASQVPWMSLEGNHEIEPDLHGRMFQAFQTRFRFPAAESGSPSQLFYSFDLGGAHVVMLGTYADVGKATQYAADSPQLKWLRADLAAFDRGRTPWLVVGMHAPWYNTYAAHYQEAECFRLAVEELLYDAGADLIFAGHVHAYERSNPVYDFQLDDCGPTHVTIGDGGNIEGLYTSWVDDPPGNCPEPVSTCVTKPGGLFCPTRQPDWSAFREPSFGHGMLELHNATEATWTWHRNQDGAAVASDSVVLRRNPQCFNQRIP